MKSKSTLDGCRDAYPRRSSTPRLFLIALLFSFLTIHAFSQGNTCATATAPLEGANTANGPIDGNGAVNLCTFPISGNPVHADWYVWTAPTDGTLNIGSCLGGVDTRLSVFTGSCGSLTCFANNDDACPLSEGGNNWASQLTDLAITGGTTYYIQWDNRWSTAGFTWNFDFVPNNDEPCDAIELTCGSSVNGSNIGAATSDLLPTSCAGGSARDVFYRFTAEAGIPYTVTVNGLNYDGVLQALTGACDGTLTEIACADEGISPNIAETIEIIVDVETEILLRTYDWSPTEGSFTLTVDCEAASNDICASAIFLPVQTPGNCPAAAFTGTTTAAGNEAPGGTFFCEDENPDVFFQFNSGTFSQVTVNISALSATDIISAVLNGCGVADGPLCDVAPTNETIDVEPSTNYIVRVSTNTSFGDPGSFNICISGVYDCPDLEANIGASCDDGNPNTGNDVVTETCECIGSPSPDNDNCANAEIVPVALPGTCTIIEGTTTFANPGSVTVCEGANPDVYYAFNSGPFSSINLTTSLGTATDIVTNIIEGDCAGASILCDFSPSLNTIVVTPNTNYLIRYSTNLSFGNTGNFSFCLEGIYDCPALGGNIGDSCDDGNPNTGGETIIDGCICLGIVSPTNDLCENAEELIVGEPGTCEANSVEGTTVGANSNGIGFCESGNQDVFYTFNSGPYSSVQIAAQPGTITDLVLNVLEGTCGGTQILCDFSPPYAPLAVTPNTEYTIRVGTNLTFGVPGTFSICVTGIYDCPDLGGNIGDACDDGNTETIDDTILDGCNCVGTPTPENNLCENAISLPVNPAGECPDNQVIGTNENATSAGLTDPCEFINPDVFYAFNSGDNTSIVITLNAITITDRVLNLLEGDCAGTSILCNINQTVNNISVTPNTDYFIRVSTNLNFGVPGTFGICVQETFDCPALNANIGDSCDDGNPDTENDTVQNGCICEGTPAGTATINGTVGWNSNCGDRAVNIRFFEVGTTNQVQVVNTTVNASGLFTVNEVSPGNYDIVVRVAGFLPKGFANVNLSVGTNALGVGTIIPGNINNDNNINIVDVSQLNAAFGSSTGSPSFNPLADLNCDGVVNIIDVSLLNAGFGQSGPSLPLVAI